MVIYEAPVSAKKTCRGEVCVFLSGKINVSSRIDISHHCKEQVLDICAIELVTKTVNLIILNFHRAPSEDANKFLKRL
jgi:hypothetical protein